MTGIGHGISETIESLKTWARQPYDETMDLGRWFLFAGLLMVITIMWTMIFKELKGE